MSEFSTSLVQQLAVWSFPILLAITGREIARTWTAFWLGDTTAKTAGRLRLNPLSYVDPVGTILIPAVLVAMSAAGAGSFLFGWARQAPLDLRNFKNPLRDLAVISASGPLSSFAMAIAWALLLRFAVTSGAEDGLWAGLGAMAKAGVAINLSLMVLHLIPIPPLDGGRVLMGVLPRAAGLRLARIEPYGMMIVLALMITPLLGAILAVPYALAKLTVYKMVGLV